ncbi:glycerophosphodiester phosphodiesterase GDPDL3-like [Iris pallida]|uniref:glycerophosphodiester phosphodiesterase n=1 Tax=Iris pallida TaxID=29817 RepID=A0AAX6FTT3_IRIPA|nr:glycerophosphodiester phosphodiesterase GDPDL3-like [Iris pallida]
MIQSTNSSVLTNFKKKTNYKLVYMVDESIGSADPSALADMRKFANAVAVNKKSIYPDNQAFTIRQTDLVKNLQASGFSVFVYLLTNEFVSQAWDFFSDPTVEINSFVKGIGVDGIITDFPRTSTRYRSQNSCLKLGDNTPNYMLPVEGGFLLNNIVDPSVQPPALAPLPVLDASDVLEPPLPSVSTKPPPSNSVPPAVQPSAVGRRCVAMSIFGTLVTLILSGSFLLRI